MWRGDRRRGVREPGTAERAGAVVASGSRGVVWALLTVSLFGTVLTADELPPPWGAVLVPVGLLGGTVSGLAAVYRLFLAFLGALNLIRLPWPRRPRSPQRTAGSATPDQFK